MTQDPCDRITLTRCCVFVYRQDQEDRAIVGTLRVPHSHHCAPPPSLGTLIVVSFVTKRKLLVKTTLMYIYPYSDTGQVRGQPSACFGPQKMGEELLLTKLSVARKVLCQGGGRGR